MDLIFFLEKAGGFFFGVFLFGLGFWLSSLIIFRKP
jgi:hypothetical protein